MNCKKCGAPLNGTEKYCGFCGEKVDVSESTPVEEPQVVFNEKQDEIKDKVTEVWNKTESRFDEWTEKVDNFVNEQVPANAYTTPDDVPNTLMNVLAFLFPIIGVIFYLVRRTEKPVMAKDALKWTLIGFAFSVFLRFFNWFLF